MWSFIYFLMSHLYSVHCRDGSFITLFFHHHNSMKNTFAIGAIAGMSTLVIAVPLLAQMTFAQQSPGTASTTAMSHEGGQTDSQDAPDKKFDARKGGHTGSNGVHEEILTGDNAVKASAAALAAVPGGTIDRVETDAEGDAYEAHMTTADGNHVTVKFDRNFTVTNIETGYTGR
jgi:hypothetical protein